MTALVRGEVIGLADSSVKVLHLDTTEYLLDGGVTTALTVMKTWTLPAKTMTKNSSLEIISHWYTPAHASGGNRIVQIGWGGTAAADLVLNETLTASTNDYEMFTRQELWNVNDLAVQRGPQEFMEFGFGEQAQLPNDFTQDTSQDVTIYFSGDLSNSNEDLYLDFVKITLYKAP